MDNNSTFSSPEWDSGDSYATGTSATVPSGRLSNNTKYYWRVRYKDNRGEWSAWSSSREFTTQSAVATPTFNPDGGTHSGSSVNVTITCATAGATIRYMSGSGTTPGSDPTTNSTVVPVNGIVNVPVPGWLKAKAWKDGMTASGVKSAVYQSALLTLSPTSRSHTSAAASGQTIGVTANVSWTATKTASWITITAGTSGTGSGTVTYSITQNTGSARSGTITISGGGITREFTVNQAGDAAMSPSGGQSVTNRRQAFAWPAVSGATWYQIWLNRNGATHSTPWVQGATTWTPPSDLPAGSYAWWVRGWGPVIGYSVWSSRADFTVPAMIPGVIPQIGPSGAQGGSNPVFRWTKDAKATWYHLWVSHPNGGTWLDKWFAMSGTGEGSVTVNGHPGGSSTWWIQGWGPDGTGPWAGPMAFSTPDPAPAKPTLIAPVGTVTSPVTFQYASARAEWYRIYVSRSGTKVLDKWTESATYNAGTLGSGTYSWWVAGWNAVSGKTVWSDQGTFTIP